MLAPLLALAITVSPHGDVSSLESAVVRVRERRAEGAAAEDEEVVVRISPGIYRLAETLRLSAADSNIRFEGADQDRTVFVGGIELGAFTAGSDGLWRLKVPAGVRVDQLFVGGRRAQRAVSPNGDAAYHHIRFNVAESNGCLVAEKDYPLLKELAALPTDELTNAAIHVYYAWDTEWLRPDRVDPQTGFLGFTAKAERDFFLWKTWILRFKAENYRAALDAPGEWFWDRRAGEILYVPRSDDDPATSVAFVPTVEQLVRIAGDAKTGDCVRNVTFSRIGFRGQAWRLPNSLALHQAAKDLGSAVEVSDARAIRFDRCRFDRLSTHAIWFAENCRGSGVADSLFTDLGASAVRIGTFVRTTDVPTEKFTGDVTVDNNIIVGGGRLFPEAVGVQIAYAADCRITHNEIADFYYTGVSVGWGWSYSPTQNRNNVIAWNHIHDLGKGVMCDMGGIYHLGEDWGARIEGNVIHHVRSYRYTGSGGEGIYMDEASCGVTIVSNLVYDTRSGAAHQHYGKDNVFANNILADVLPGCAVMTRTRVEDHRSFAFRNNIVAWRPGSAALNSGGTKRGIDFANNLYWCTDGKGTGAFNGLDFAEWTENDGSLFADPKFRDPAKGDYTVAADSPALALGFVPWDVSRAGVRGAAWRRKAASFEMRPDVEIPEPARYRGIPSWRTDFSGRTVGSGPKFPLRAHGRPIAVVAEPSACGGKCLKISDSKSRPGFDPYVSCTIPYAERRLAFSYRIKYDANASFAQEWREHKDKCRNGQYATGLWLRANAKAFVVEGTVPDGRGGFVGKTFALKSAAVGAWLDCRLVMTFAKGERVRCVVTLTNETGESATTGEFFAFDEFERPNWTAFFACGGNETDYLIDDVSYKAE